ncbi:asparagine synthase, glutamine-hydrolyzing [Cylindrospermum stagnale PCC 7417]|uniref:asparagine synthase (glutamine-hydrolyzing) n=1 Tax=Cylindrospermum stagnale PCC 7417 TaxID=56107 RepID=K9X759_9NOST|nr:asparagine synthase (glutamine-hydrolyzing) [Cylindrospermum stagnale]AFZ27939.1 asparagine synthase, glutamine-hydrolyzing [Cylindrospermum stagnale PCC 7417]
MCGIAGILTKTKIKNNLEPLILRMQNALQHRGPDDQGIYISPNKQVAFAHTRLSIIDLSTAGHQPMSTSDGRYWITFNGEIYNFQQLRHSLESQGEQFYSNTDTEVILKLYQRQGAECVNNLRGMFAFAIWDNQEQTCFIARDPLGIKPLYYWQSGSTLVFASEIRAILASKLLTIALSPQGLYGYLISGTVPEPYTLIEGIRCLEAGHWLHWQTDKLTQQQYWQINFTNATISLTEAKEKVRNALVDSIKNHFISDVPVGIFLSGGIDSSSVVALARQTQKGNLRTYSIAFEENEWNEGALAQRIAKEFDTAHTEYKVTASLGRELLPQFLASIDQPSIDGFNTFCVSQVAHKDGTKVVLSGLGGDEIFGGYKTFQQVPNMLRWGQQLQKIQPISTGLGRGLASWGKSPRLKRLGDFLQQKPTTSAAYRSFRGIFSQREAWKITQHYCEDSWTKFPIWEEGIFQDMNLTTNLPSLEDEVSFLELTCYMRNQLLRDSDVMSMAWSLELRVPLVDRVLLETIASIPSAMRLAPSKQLLIQAVPELPNWLLDRPKRGFFFPFQQWIDQEWSDYFPAHELSKNIDLKLWYRRWSLAILDYWLQQITG